MSIQEDKAMKLKDGKILYDDLRNRVEYLRGNEVLDFGTIPSKNLNITPYQSTTLAGLTITKNSDNSLTITGQPESTSIYYIYVANNANSDYRWKLPAGTYTLSGGFSGSQSVGISLYTSQSTTSVAAVYNTGGSGQPVTFTTTQEYWAIIGFCWKNSTALITEPVTFYMQLEKGPQATSYVSPFITTQESKKLHDAIYGVKMAGKDVVTEGIANIPFAISDGKSAGVVIIPTGGTKGIDINSNNELRTRAAVNEIKGGADSYRPITPCYQHTAAFYGLSKLAGVDLASASNITVGTYPDTSKAAIQNMLGITSLFASEESATATAAHAVNSLFMMDGKLNRATSAIAVGDAVEVGTNCEVVKADEVFVKRTDYATTTSYGLLKIGTSSSGLQLDPSGYLKTYCALSTDVKAGTDYYKPIVPVYQHAAVFYGLSKVAGVDLKNETVTVGTYPEASKTAIRSMIGAGTPLDVQLNGTSIVSIGIANIPTGAEGRLGVVQCSASGSVYIDNSGVLLINRASNDEVKAGTQTLKPIVPSTQHRAVFFGLSKVAGVDLAERTLSGAVYPDDAKAAIRSMIGAENGDDLIKVQDTQPATSATKLWMLETAPTGVQVPTVAELEAGYVAKTQYATDSIAGIIKTSGSFGLSMRSSPNQDTIMVVKASADAIKAGNQNYQPIVPTTQHQAVFYGLATAAGDSTQASSSNAVGTYTNDASTAIRSMLGAVGDVQVNEASVVSNGVANIPVCSSSTFGVVKVDANSFGIKINQEGKLYIDTPSLTEIKAGTQAYKPIVAATQHTATFYGLAKAAGDTTMSSSSNAVGIYTAEAKAAIQSMLGVESGIELIETISGTTPTITGQPNTTYQCGEVSTISITPPANGTIDVFFTSGSTAAVLTIPSTVKFPAWFDAEALETNTIYEILITNGTYGSVMTWQS